MAAKQDLIYNVIRATPTHMTAEQIYLALRREDSAVSMATVYRNLGLLCDAGQIMRIAVPGEPDRYDKNTVPHQHMVCDCCGALTDLRMRDLRPEIEAAAGTAILSYSLSVRHLCPACQRKQL